VGKAHLVFIEDDPTEIETFARLYEGDLFELTPVCVQFPSRAMADVEQALDGRVPNLFVLDLFFLAVNNAPKGFTAEAAEAARSQLRSVLSAAEELERMFFDNTVLAHSGKELLRTGADLVDRAQRMLRQWCDVLGQSPLGGIGLMREIQAKYPGVPKVFYSRKAGVADVKLALEAGAIDVLIKPHRSVEDAEAAGIRDALARYCEGKGPEWRRGS
jgi:CheY-like chemotaxis protein